MTGALEGIRVLELSRVLAGPSAGQTLADLGADVIKVEHPAGGDDTRGWGPPYLERPDGGPSQESAYYLGANRNKRSIAIDFAVPAGQELVLDLARQSDVIIENFRTGGLLKYGLDYASIHSINERLVYCSVTGFGQDGPRADLGGYDFILQAMGGLMSVTGRPDGEPMKVGVPIADLYTGQYAAIGIIAALFARTRTGQGQHIDLSLFDAQVAMLANQGMNYLVGNECPQRMANDHPNVVPCGIYGTADSYVAVTIGNDAQFIRFCAALGREDLANDPQFGTNAGRSANREHLNAEITRSMSMRSSIEWAERFARAKVAAGPVNTIAEVFDDPQAKARGLSVQMDHPYGPLSVIASPIKLSDTPVTYRRPPPLLGEHTDEILRSTLDLSPSKIAELREAGVVR